MSRFIHCWRSITAAAEASVCIIHGLGEHGGRYGQLADDLAAQGFQVWAMDQQGHGQDPGQRGIISSYDDLLREVGLLLEHAVKSLPGRSCFLLGHSMGGNLAVNYVLRHPEFASIGRLPTAVLASSPFFRTQREPRGLINGLARCAVRVAPKFRVGTGVRSQWLTDDPRQQALVDQDPLYHRRVSLQLGAALIDSGRWAIENASLLPVPTLIIHGADDRLTLPEASAEFARKAQQAGKDCQFHLLKGHQHESFRDKERLQVIKIIRDYFNSFVSSDLRRNGNDH